MAGIDEDVDEEASGLAEDSGLSARAPSDADDENSGLNGFFQVYIKRADDKGALGGHPDRANRTDEVFEFEAFSEPKEAAFSQEFYKADDENCNFGTPGEGSDCLTDPLNPPDTVCRCSSTSWQGMWVAWLVPLAVLWRRRD